jgi:hypothetical protein
MENLQDISGRLSTFAGDTAVEASLYLTTCTHERLRLASVHQLTSIERFDQAYNLCSSQFLACKDIEVERLEALDASLPMDDIDDCLLVLMPPPGDEGAVEERRRAREKQCGYRCLRTFICAPLFRKQLRRLCAYPWVGCGNTVDSLLRQLNDVPGDQSDIDSSYHTR